ncbi:MAG: hypothetical protein MUF61_00330 [archaeon]|nr:hypothetical protein [archaeon]
MKKTRGKIARYWDNLIASSIPRPHKYHHVESEVLEHFDFVKWAFKRIVIPLICFYVLMSLVFDINIFGSLFVSLLLFIYSNFLPDTDFLIKKTNSKNKESLWYDRYLLLFFAPVLVYYIIAGRARPLYAYDDRCFHNLITMLIYGIFLFVIATIFWPETLNRVMFPLFGMLGFLLHLIVDGRIKLLANW